MVRVFVDTDVVISSSISHVGAAHQLLRSDTAQKFISNLSREEARGTAKKLTIDFRKVQKQLRLCTSIEIKEDLISIKKVYGTYINDVTDSHVVAGAVCSKSQFIVSYNLKDFKIESIKRKFDIIVLTPGTLLQYLR